MKAELDSKHSISEKAIFLLLAFLLLALLKLLKTIFFPTWTFIFISSEENNRKFQRLALLFTLQVIPVTSVWLGPTHHL